MTRRAKSRTAFLIGLLFLVCLKCCGQFAVQVPVDKGFLVFAEHQLMIIDNEDSAVYVLEPIKMDTVFNVVLVTVISADGIGFLRIGDFDLTYHFKIQDRSRMRRYVFLK